MHCRSEQDKETNMKTYSTAPEDYECPFCQVVSEGAHHLTGDVIAMPTTMWATFPGAIQAV